MTERLPLAPMSGQPNPELEHVGGPQKAMRHVLDEARHESEEARRSSGTVISAVQKYEQGTNRIGASRIQQISEILRVPASFLFEGSPTGISKAEGLNEAPSPAYVSDFLGTCEGLALIRAFIRITDRKLRRSIINMVEQIAARGSTDRH
jgi:transcriptional regulator with XRE-family HTH domain